MDPIDLAKNSYENAINYMKNDKEKAFEQFLVTLTLCPNWRPSLLNQFMKLTETISHSLLKDGRVKEFFKCYEQALELYPHCPEMKQFFAKHLISIGFYFQAFTFYRAACLMQPEIIHWQRELDNLKNFLVSRWHFMMLNDNIRNTAYKHAILKAVKSHDSVLDIGCGSGLLTLYASLAKPKRLVAIDSNEALYNVASSVFNDNKIETITLNDMSTNVKPVNIKGRTSALVIEVFDAGFFGEGILQTMIHARRKLMSNLPSDVIIPKSGTLHVCGVQSKSLAKRHIFHDNCLKDTIKFNSISVYKDSQEPYDSEDLTSIKDLQYITDVKEFLHIDFYNLSFLEELLSGKNGIDDVELHANSDGCIHAYVVWFDLHLTDDISITTDPRAANRARAWDQAVFYLNQPRTVKKNEKISIKLRCASGKLELIKPQPNEDCFPVPPRIVRCLNDSAMINICDSAVSAACIHLAQVYSNISINVLDLSPFPLTGFLLLSRGVHHLTCLAPTEAEKDLILRVCELNGVSADRIEFLDEYSDILRLPQKKYHIIVNNLINESFGELNITHATMLKDLAQKLVKNGLSMPHRLNLQAKLIYSEELERLNRVDDENVLGFNISDFMNVYSVKQNFISDLSSLPYVSMSEDLVLIDDCVVNYGNNVLDVELLQDGPINAVICWFEIQVIENGEIYSTKIEESWSLCSVYLLEAGLTGVAKQKGNLLMCCDENGFLKIALDLD